MAGDVNNEIWFRSNGICHRAGVVCRFISSGVLDNVHAD